jgi:hypothetical protein
MGRAFIVALIRHRRFTMPDKLLATADEVNE